MNPENGPNSARTNKKHLGVDGIPENKGRGVEGYPFSSLGQQDFWMEKRSGEH